MKVYRGVKRYLHSFFFSVLDGYEWSTSRFGRFTPGKLPKYAWNRWLQSRSSTFRV
jgi:hypothetical protein